MTRTRPASAPGRAGARPGPTCAQVGGFQVLRRCAPGLPTRAGRHSGSPARRGPGSLRVTALSGASAAALLTADMQTIPFSPRHSSRPRAGRSTGVRIECSAVYTVRCILKARFTSRDNKRFASHGFCHCARPSRRGCSGARRFVISSAPDEECRRPRVNHGARARGPACRIHSESRCTPEVAGGGAVAVRIRHSRAWAAATVARPSRQASHGLAELDPGDSDDRPDSDDARQ